VRSFWNEIKHSISNQAISHTLAPELIQQISLRLVLCSSHEIGFHDTYAAVLELRGQEKVVSRPRRKAFWSRPRRFKVRMKWWTEILDVEKAKLIQKVSTAYDAVRHELSLSAKQAQEAGTDENKQGSPLVTIAAKVLEDLRHYFTALFVFLRNRYVFADLIVNKHYLPAEKIVVFYIIGIGVSVFLPYVITFGMVGPDELMSFGKFPPILDEIAELLKDALFIMVQAITLHAAFRVLKHRGDFRTSVIALLFVNAFFQIFDRPFYYLIYDVSWGAFDQGEISSRLRIASNLESIRWLLYAYFIVPFTYWKL